MLHKQQLYFFNCACVRNTSLYVCSCMRARGYSKIRESFIYNHAYKLQELINVFVYIYYYYRMSAYFVSLAVRTPVCKCTRPYTEAPAVHVHTSMYVHTLTLYINRSNVYVHQFSHFLSICYIYVYVYVSATPS